MDCVAPQVTHIVALVIVAYGAHDGAGIDLAVLIIGVVRDGAVPAVVVLALWRQLRLASRARSMPSSARSSCAVRRTFSRLHPGGSREGWELRETIHRKGQHRSSATHYSIVMHHSMPLLCSCI